jgi:hypothetical protein
MTSNQYDSYAQGCSCVTMVLDNVKRWSNPERIKKPYRSLDRGLQLTHVKEESIVIVYHQGTVKQFSGFVLTARHFL